MKYLKMLGLAAIAATALTALVGAGSASAGVVACTVNTGPCPSGNEYTGAIESHLKTGTNAVLSNSVDTVTCTESTMNGEITTATNANNNSTGKITAVNFGGCKDQNGETCTTTVEHLPWHAELTSTEVAGKINGNGKMTVTSGGSGGPQAKVVCGSFLSCTFGVESATVDVIGGNPAIIKTTGIEMTHISGFLCPTTATWTAEYSITKPTSLFVI
jgi:hypothetical protein